MKIGNIQEQWLKGLESEEPFYSPNERAMIGKALFSKERISEKEMAELVRKAPEKYFKGSH